MTNLPGADLNAACSGPNGARLMDEPSNERCQRTCNLKYDEYTRGMDRASPTPLSHSFTASSIHSLRFLFFPHPHAAISTIKINVFPAYADILEWTAWLFIRRI
ncbi:hypothetical protein EXT66_16950 [Pectobacterium carotovorum subsp. carotovorum]|nr:hypothetical protein [Pectobacterium carotovorum subsp. carotovorum]MCL6348442.1 hypothetical protein [Pectobacterium carotovorum subsp. carotovorum]MCL6402946.1 hypothetical protein [Pectobacterium carotovorum subsp. carotovorum]